VRMGGYGSLPPLLGSPPPVGLSPEQMATPTTLILGDAESASALFCDAFLSVRGMWLVLSLKAPKPNVFRCRFVRVASTSALPSLGSCARHFVVPYKAPQLQPFRCSFPATRGWPFDFHRGLLMSKSPWKNLYSGAFR